ncbi:MAG: YdcF family protein [Terriglobia bacterium]
MKARGKKILFQLFFAYLPSLLLAYILILYVLIRRSASLEESQEADIIVVLGAAQYNGRPSPVFRSRLDHAAELFHNKKAGKIMTTGGYGFDPRYSEAGVGKLYLTKQNIPEDCIYTETSGLTTSESIERAIDFLKQNNLTRVIAVSDGFHLFRIKRIFQDHQIKAYGSPAPHSVIESNLRFRILASLREVFVFTAYIAKHYLHLSFPFLDTA